MNSLAIIFAVFGILVLANAETKSPKWTGSWITTDREENYAAFVSALNLPALYSGTPKVINTIEPEGDAYRYKYEEPEKGFATTETFKIGHEYTKTVAGHPMKLMVTEVEDDMLIVFTPTDGNKQFSIKFEPKGDVGVETYTVGDTVGRRWFKKHTPN